MIRDLLGIHDRERANEMRVGRRGRVLDAPVKLYLQERVEYVETTEKFAQAQERARAAQDAASKGAETRAAQVQATIEQLTQEYVPDLAPPDDVAEPDRHTLWRHAYDQMIEWYYDRRPFAFSRAQANQLEQALYGKLHAAFEQQYPEVQPDA